MKNKIISGTVTGIQGNTATVSYGQFIGRLPVSEVKGCQIGMQIKACLTNVLKSPSGDSVGVLTRNTEFISEYLSGIDSHRKGYVEIGKIVRSPGFRTKVILTEKEAGGIPKLIGVKGKNLIRLSKELGEVVEVIPHHTNTTQFIKNCLLPGALSNQIEVLLDSNKSSALVYAPKSILGRLVGSGGVNIELASKLTGFTLEVVPKGRELASQGVDNDYIDDLIEAGIYNTNTLADYLNGELTGVELPAHIHDYLVSSFDTEDEVTSQEVYELQNKLNCECGTVIEYGETDTSVICPHCNTEWELSEE